MLLKRLNHFLSLNIPYINSSVILLINTDNNFLSLGDRIFSFWLALSISFLILSAIFSLSCLLFIFSILFLIGFLKNTFEILLILTQSMFYPSQSSHESPIFCTDRQRDSGIHERRPVRRRSAGIYDVFKKQS